ncbi:MAG: hypothetical protein ACWA5K_01895, partial [bacterium]
IRTPDILLPKQARYQTALFPEIFPNQPRLEARIILARFDQVNNVTARLTGGLPVESPAGSLF